MIVLLIYIVKPSGEFLDQIEFCSSLYTSGSLVHPFIQSLNTLFMDLIYAGSILGTRNMVC